MRKFYDALTDEEKAEFWAELHQALKYRGWDRAKGLRVGKTPCGCHACDFIKRVEELAAKHGIEFAEYT